MIIPDYDELTEREGWSKGWSNVMIVDCLHLSSKESMGKKGPLELGSTLDKGEGWSNVMIVVCLHLSSNGIYGEERASGIRIDSGQSGLVKKRATKLDMTGDSSGHHAG
ncbi:hypothetical protein CEXT_745911 [Caerostris extrusa]|uniref:Uncharacterized protein n=1 Tax=Caerostris extrusa TaxID=172846 RepID=A0AAV4XK71_CAEEX|nr:hypothetical protein CEXT_745911 [Caerostris extrusa]